MKKIFFSAAVFSVIIAACTKDNFEKDHPKVIVIKPPTAITDTCKDSIYYDPQIKRIISNSCAIAAGCHTSSDAFDLTTFAKAKAKATLIKQKVVVEGSMPYNLSFVPVPITDQCVLDKIKAWVDAGTPEKK